MSSEEEEAQGVLSSEDLVNEAVGTLKGDVGKFIDTMAMAAQARVCEIRERNQEFIKGYAQVKCWLLSKRRPYQKHQAVADWLLKNVQTEQHPERYLPGPIERYCPNFPWIDAKRIMQLVPQVEIALQESETQLQEDADNVRN